VAYAAVLFVTLARQRRGLRLAQWRAFVDRKRARTGVFIQCGTVIDPLSSKPLTIVRSGVANSASPEWDTDLIREEVTARGCHPARGSGACRASWRPWGRSSAWGCCGPARPEGR